MNAVVVRPVGGRITCHQGQGSLIDFAIVAKAALPYVTVDIVSSVPWSPHDGIALTINRDARSVKINRCPRPQPFRDAPQRPSGGMAPSPITWAQAMEKAEVSIGDLDLRKCGALEAQRRLVAAVARSSNR